MKISGFNQKEWLEIRATFFIDGVEEMMRNAGCSEILFHVNNLVAFSQRVK
jgi:hypothetical protein